MLRGGGEGGVNITNTFRKGTHRNRPQELTAAVGRAPSMESLDYLLKEALTGAPIASQGKRKARPRDRSQLVLAIVPRGPKCRNEGPPLEVLVLVTSPPLALPPLHPIAVFSQ